MNIKILSMDMIQLMSLSCVTRIAVLMVIMAMGYCRCCSCFCSSCFLSSMMVVMLVWCRRTVSKQADWEKRARENERDSLSAFLISWAWAWCDDARDIYRNIFLTQRTSRRGAKRTNNEEPNERQRMREEYIGAKRMREESQKPKKKQTCLHAW